MWGQNDPFGASRKFDFSVLLVLSSVILLTDFILVIVTVIDNDFILVIVRPIVIIFS